MSDIKRRKMHLRSDSKKRSSFDERVCDDLCEVLLQYLPFEDKFRLECVSKQFQRNVYKRQFELVLDHSLNYCLWKNGGRRMMSFIGIAFKTILKKCPNIETIDLKFFYSSSYQKTFALKYNKIVDIIIKNCDHLKHFELYVNQLIPNTIDNFCKKFATKLSSIRLFRSYELFDKQLLTSLSNITDLTLIRGLQFDDNYYRLSNIFDDNNQCLVRNLRRLSLKYVGHELNLLLTVIQSNPKLKIIDILSDNTDQNSLCQLLSQISNLSDLRQLHINIDFVLTDSCVAKALKQMAEKCPKMIAMYFNLYFKVENLSHGLVLEIIDSLKHFKQLKRICLSLRHNFQFSNEKTLISAKHLSVCKELTHLSLYSIQVNDSFFKDIGALLPGLRYLNISRLKISESILEELAQLNNIEKLFLNQEYHYGPRLTKESAAQLYVKCPKLKKIYIT